MEAGGEQRSKINLRVALRRRGSFPASRALSASPWPAVGLRSAPRSRFAPYRVRIAVRLSLRFSSSPPPLLCVATPTTCQQPCSLTRSLGGREYNMTDGHSRTNTVGHRAVRGRRMPPDVACSALRARLTCVCVARSRGVLRRTQGDREKSPFRLRHPRFDSGLQSPYAPRLYVSLRSPTRRTCVAVSSSPLLSSASPLSTAPSPLSRASHATQHKPHRRRETRHMSGTTFEAANPDGRRRPARVTCRPSRRTIGRARHSSACSNMAAAQRGVADRY